MDEDDKGERVVDGSGGGGGGECGGEWSELNEMTLLVMSNRNRYDKYKKTVANTSEQLVELFNKEKIYYKERIVAMTRGLFDVSCENDDINRAHEEYLKSCIEYLKWNDITEMVAEDSRTETREDVVVARENLQKKIRETEIVDGVSGAADAAAADDALLQIIPSDDSCSSTNNSDMRVMAFANKMCMRRKTMDDFIVMKPIPGNTDEDIKARLPKVRDYHNDIMKRCGVPSDTPPQ
jgi:hypothetical protein